MLTVGFFRLKVLLDTNGISQTVREFKMTFQLDPVAFNAALQPPDHLCERCEAPVHKADYYGDFVCAECVNDQADARRFK